MMGLLALTWSALPSPSVSAKTKKKKPLKCRSVKPYAGEPVRELSDGAWTRAAARPIDGALSAETVALLGAALDRIHAELDAPGVAAAVAVPGRGIWSGARGLAADDPPRSLDTRTPMFASAVGMAFTATLVLQLIDEDVLDPDDPISIWIADFPAGDLITVEHLIAHTSGVQGRAADPDSGRTYPYYRPPDVAVGGAGLEGLLFCPGERFAFADTGYVMLGQIVEAHRGALLHDVIEAHIVQRAELRDTAAQRPGIDLEGMATGHMHGRAVADEVSYATPHGAGIVASTPRDLIVYLHALLSGRLVDRERVRGMYERLHPMSKTGVYYGRGLMLFESPRGPMLGHSGGSGGFRAVVGYLLERDVYVAVMANAEVSLEGTLPRLVDSLATTSGSAPTD
jgi:D-alanyl-D-alanine carboxypeptidase